MNKKNRFYGEIMKKNDIKNIISTLEITYPYAHCSLEYSNEFELLIATRLSAQCTDLRVNIVKNIV
jgi:endonuclease-3